MGTSLPYIATARQNGKSLLTSQAVMDPVNRKARRIFNSLFRRKKLKHLAVTGLFTAGFVQFCALNLPEHW